MYDANVRRFGKAVCTSLSSTTLLFIQSVSTVDVPVMTAFLMVVGLMFVVVNLVVDLLYLAIDPRLRLE